MEGDHTLCLAVEMEVIRILLELRIYNEDITQRLQLFRIVQP